MDQTLDALLGFAPDYDSPIPYMRRTREYYAAIGYTTPYRWAHYLAAPFTKLRKPLSQSKVAIITTAAPYQPDKGDQGPGAAYNGSAKFYQVYSGDTAHDHDLRISHIGYDRTHTTATDSGTWFPLPALRRAATAGRIGALAPRFHGAPTNRSHRVTVETDAPEILARVREDGADVAIVVPNCPVCHQTSTLVARHLEANGIPTVADGLRQGHRRARRRARASCSATSPSATAPASRTTSRPRTRRWSWRCICWKPRPARRPRCSRRSAGTKTASGSWTT